MLEPLLACLALLYHLWEYPGNFTCLENFFKAPGLSLGFTLFIGDFGVLMLQLYHILLRPRAYSILTDRFQEGDSVFFFLSFCKEVRKQMQVEWILKYSISSHCQMLKSFQCVHQFVTGKLYPICRIIENDLEIFTQFLQMRSVSNHAKPNIQRNGDPP